MSIARFAPHQVFDALASPVRINLLAATLGETRTVTQLADRLALTNSTATYNIRILDDAGLLDREPGRGRRPATYEVTPLGEQLLALVDEWVSAGVRGAANGR